MSFFFSVTDFLGNAQVFLVALHCSPEFIKPVISSAENGVGFTFQCPVTIFLGNDEAFIGVLYCSLVFAEN